MLLRLTMLPAACALVLAACGGDEPAPDPAPVAAAAPLRGAQAKAPAPGTAAALTQIPNVAAARRRLAYVHPARVADAAPAGSRTAVLHAVLGDGARHAAQLPARADATVVRVGAAATVVQEPAGGDPVVHADDPRLARRLAAGAPRESAITPMAPDAVQSCLGDTAAQTILGPGTMGHDAALGVGLARSEDRPAGLQLRICGAPKYLRHIHAMERTLNRRFGGLGAGATRAVVGEREIGEREIVEAALPAAELPRRELLALLAGGPALRALAWI